MGAVLLTVLARLLGLPELFAVATALVALVGAALVYVRLTRFQVGATRQLRPARVHAGGSSRVDLTVTNEGRRRSPVLAASDSFDGGATAGGRRWAHFSLAPLQPGEQARAAYRLPTEQRGLFPMGPLQLAVSDPFGLARRSVETAAITTLTVFPHVDPVLAMPNSHGPDPNGAAGPSSALSPSGVDFYALREYQTGDDLRRVHWPSTARLDDLMIRQDELPWQGRAAVLVDLRRVVHTAESLELVLSAAASILTASWRSQALVRLVTTGGIDSGFGSGYAHMDTILERLAAAAVHTGDGLSAALSGLGGRAGDGALAVVTTVEAGSDDLRAVGRLRGRHRPPVLVVVGPRSGGRRQRGGAPGAAPPLVATLVQVTPEAPFATAWDRVMAASAAIPTSGARARPW